MRVAVVGAGMAGLGAARTLQAAGHRVTVFEKSHVLGGRCATRRQGGFHWNSGATSVAPEGTSLGRAMLEELPTDDLVEIQKPIWVHEDLVPMPGAPGGRKRYVYGSGMQTLARLLAEGLEVRLNTPVESLAETQDEVSLGDLGAFDRAILTAPIPQTDLLLHRAGQSRAYANVRYRSCLSVLLGYDLPAPETEYFALLNASRKHRLGWLSLEHGPRATFVAQMSPAYSFDRYSDSDEAILDDVRQDLVRLYGSEFARPEVWSLKKWKYSQPDVSAPLASVNRASRRIWIAGDGVSAGKLEHAYESGVAVANLILGAAR